MLTKDNFNKGIEELIIEYSDKGFKMNRTKAEQWYEHMKHFSDEEYKHKIDIVLRTCPRSPYMADVINAKEEVYIHKEFDFTGLF